MLIPKLPEMWQGSCDAVTKVRGTWLAGPCAISMLFPISLQLVHCCEDVFLTFLLDKFVKCSTLCSGVLSHVLMQGQ
uniref:Uncharacterized protein n=1 Tax=Populus trichocarpa TaxID=3694 RepID=A0A2K2AKM3_POPTR